MDPVWAKSAAIAVLIKKVSKAAPRIAAEVLARTRNLIVGQALKMRDAHARRVQLNSPEKLSCGK